MKSNHLFQKGVGVFAIAFASFLTLGFIININKAGEVKVDDIAALVIIVILPMIAGVWAITNANKKDRKALFESREREVLTIAKKKNGKLTASELAMNSKLSLREAELVLNEFHTNGYVLIGNASNGAVVYDFHELLSVREKNGSENLLDL